MSEGDSRSRSGGEESDRTGAAAAGSAIHTFLIADVRGYTRFTQEHGDEAAAALAARFAAIARKGVEARGGKVVELRGDEALAVFTSARQAIRAALYLQDLFLEESIADPGAPLLVGIGLDAGEAVAVEAGYRGGALNLAARLCAIAAPGEVLASNEVTHLARRTEGVRFEHRGPVQLKGLNEPVVVIRVISEESDAAAKLKELAPESRRPGLASAPKRLLSSRRRVALLVLAAVLVAAVGVAAARQFVPGASPRGTPVPAIVPPMTGCFLYSGELEDRSFNQAVYDGLTRAVTELGITTRARGAATDADVPVGLKTLVDQDCDLIVANSHLDAVIASAKVNPTQRYLILDPFEDPSLPNILGVSFRVEESAFLAGYLSAGMSRTGAVATFGGLPIPTVVPYMAGFAAGVMKYNIDHETHVRLLGWDPADSTGTFISISDFSAFDNTKRAREIAQGQLKEGAAVLFPVAGNAGHGAAEAAKSAGDSLLVGVDFDAFFQSPEYAELWLTSVRKRYDVAVKDVVALLVSGRFRGGESFVGTLANGSVDIAPFHNLDARVPVALKAELNKLSSGIKTGDISVDPHDYLPS